jgi:hypothetical protein
MNIQELDDYEFVFFDTDKDIACAGLLQEENLFSGDINYSIFDNHVNFFTSNLLLKVINIPKDMISLLNKKEVLHLLCLKEDEVIICSKVE